MKRCRREVRHLHGRALLPFQGYNWSSSTRKGVIKFIDKVIQRCCVYWPILSWWDMYLWCHGYCISLLCLPYSWQCIPTWLYIGIWSILDVTTLASNSCARWQCVQQANIHRLLEESWYGVWPRSPSQTQQICHRVQIWNHYKCIPQIQSGFQRYLVCWTAGLTRCTHIKSTLWLRYYISIWDGQTIYTSCDVTNRCTLHCGRGCQCSTHSIGQTQIHPDPSFIGHPITMMTDRWGLMRQAQTTQIPSTGLLMNGI